jgi:3-oxoacyl-(acyl-carrier-protein) synthase
MAAAMAGALRRAGLDPSAIGYVNAHGTATELNDLLETQALHAVFGGHAPRLRISSTKAAHGHTMGAAGAVEAIATILALVHGAAPPTLNLRKADPRCDLDYTPNQTRELDATCGLSNSFAFGGHYATLVFRVD